MMNSMICQICKTGYIVSSYGYCIINPNDVSCNVNNCQACST